MINSKNYYDNIATNYHMEALAKMNYLNAVDNYIIKTMTDEKINGFMDVGTGDGRRALKLINYFKITSNIVLVDDSKEMLEQMELDDNIILFSDNVINYKSTQRFSLITCLWNVLGHFPSVEDRIDFFKLVEEHLRPGGVFIYDVNNRYNIAHYGSESVANNIIKDRYNNANSGWFDLATGGNKTKVYIHSPFDIENYIKPTHLTLEETVYIDYTTGVLKSNFLEGQLVYKLRKPLENG